MAFITWSDTLAVNVEEIDRQHQRLIQIINSLHDAMKVGAPKAALDRIMSDLVSYTRFHFECEENLMRRNNYPDIEKHRQEHDSLTATVKRFEEDLKAGRVALSVPLMQFLKTWLKEHISNSDMAYSEHMNAAGVRR